MTAEVLLHEAGRALKWPVGPRSLRDLQRRLLATLVVMHDCTAQQAAEALAEGERELNSRGYSIPWAHLEGNLSYPLQIACDGLARLRWEARGRLRLVQGGAL